MTANEFNLNHKIGDTIQFKDEKGNIITAKTRWTAEVLEDSKEHVVYVEGSYNAVKLKDVIL